MAGRRRLHPRCCFEYTCLRSSGCIIAWIHTRQHSCDHLLVRQGRHAVVVGWLEGTIHAGLTAWHDMSSVSSCFSHASCVAQIFTQCPCRLCTPFMCPHNSHTFLHSSHFLTLPGPVRLGRWSMPLSATACLWIGLVSVVFCLPTKYPVNVSAEWLGLSAQVRMAICSFLARR